MNEVKIKNGNIYIDDQKDGIRIGITFLSKSDSNE